MLFEIWLDDETMVDGDTIAAWEAARGEFVQVVIEVKPGPGTRHSHMGGSYYKMLDDKTIISFGVGQRWKYIPAALANEPDETVDQRLRDEYPRWKFGKWIENTVYERIRDSAMQE